MTRFGKYYLLAIASTVLFFTLCAAVINGNPTARQSGNEIVISWSTLDETGVQRFDILRHSGNQTEFTVIGSVTQLKGNNSTYDYIDQSVFKTQDRAFVYKIRVISGQNPAPESREIVVSYFTSSTAKRTWGSIKAMFR